MKLGAALTYVRRKCQESLEDRKGAKTKVFYDARESEDDEYDTDKLETHSKLSENLNNIASICTRRSPRKKKKTVLQNFLENRSNNENYDPGEGLSSSPSNSSPNKSRILNELRSSSDEEDEDDSTNQPPDSGFISDNPNSSPINSRARNRIESSDSEAETADPATGDAETNASDEDSDSFIDDADADENFDPGEALEELYVEEAEQAEQEMIQENDDDNSNSDDEMPENPLPSTLSRAEFQYNPRLIEGLRPYSTDPQNLNNLSEEEVSKMFCHIMLDLLIFFIHCSFWTNSNYTKLRSHRRLMVFVSAGKKASGKALILYLVLYF